jgi:hypothetical protein
MEIWREITAMRHAESLCNLHAASPIDGGGFDEDDTHNYTRIILGDIYLVNHHKFNFMRKFLESAVCSTLCVD